MPARLAQAARHATVTLLCLLATWASCACAHSQASPTGLVEPGTSAELDARPHLSGLGGGLIAFVSERDGPAELFLMNANGTEQTCLTLGGWPTTPAWSPDGRLIAYQYRYWGVRRLQSIDWGQALAFSDGSSQTSLLDQSADGLAWSPDGSLLAFGCEGTLGGICGVTPDGSEVRLLVSTAGFDHSPTWSPDGHRLAFVSDGPDGDAIMVADLGSADVVAAAAIAPLAPEVPESQDDPSWSPLGTLIAYCVAHGRQWELYVSQPDVRRTRRLTHNTADDCHPTWAPDGSRLAFQSDLEGNWDIWLINVDGTGREQLTTDAASDYQPCWRP
jgi:Tol biopolymer transport system component